MILGQSFHLFFSNFCTRYSLPRRECLALVQQQPHCVNIPCVLCIGATVDDLPHALISCNGNNGVGWKIVEGARSSISGVTIEQLLNLDFGIDESKELVIVWWLAAGF